MASIAERIKEGLIIRNMTQSELVSKTKLNKSSISSYISGKYEPKQKAIYLIAEALNVSEPWLMGLDVPLTRTLDKNITSMIPATGTVPVYGSIPAGFPALAEQYIEDYMLTTIPNPHDYFALKVKGTSMINAGIVDGCKVLCHKQNTAENGQIVVCRVNGDEATLKRFKQQDDIVILLPENPEFEPRIIPVSKFDSGEAEIIGIVKQIIIDL